MARSSAILSSVWSSPGIWAVALAVVASWIYYRIVFRKTIALCSKLPGPFALPLLGHLYLAFALGSANDVFLEFWEVVKNTGSGVAGMYCGPWVAVGIWNPEDVGTILSSNIHLEKSSEYSLFKPWFGDGLLISTGEKWRNHRKLIAPTFHLSVLKTFVTLFNENSRAVVERMRKEIGKEFDAHDYMVETTVEILLETAMGVNKRTQESAYDYGIAVMKMCDIIHFRHLKVWLRNDFLFSFTKLAKKQKNLLKTIHNLTTKVVRDKLLNSRMPPKSLSSEDIVDNDDTVPTDGKISFGKNIHINDDIDDDLGEKRRIPFLDQLVEISEGGVVFTSKEIKEQVDTIMFEGHDTTAAAASFFLCVMGNHQDIQARCLEELTEIFGDSDRSATFQDTLEMKYLERCILETLRMFPPVPVIGRKLTEDLKISNGLILPKGTTVGVLIYGIHNDEKLYPNHNVFNPDNFLPEKVASRHPYSFIPFSAGPRSCVGRKYAMLKLKILLSTILRNYRIKSDIPESNFRLQGDIILKRSEGFKVKIEPRKAM